MSTARQSPGDETNRRAPDAPAWKLQVALLGGAVAWLLHLLLAYLIAEFGCLTNLGSTTVAGISVVSWLLLLLTFLTLGMAIAATMVSWKLRTRETDAAARGDRGDDGTDPTPFTARTGLFMNLLFVFIILVQSIPILYFLSDC